MHIRIYGPRLARGPRGVDGPGGRHRARGRDRTVEPLNQYAVSGRVTTDQLARAGYDLNEAKAIGKSGKLGIVATPAQAQALRDKGATVEALAQRRKTAPPSPLTDPAHGYDVFRPWSLKPAPCPRAARRPTSRSSSGTTTSRRATRAWSRRRRSALAPRAADQGLQDHRRCALHARRRPPGHALRVHPACTRVDLGRGQPAPLRLVHRPPERPRHQAAAPAERGLVHPDDEPGRLRLHLHVRRHAPLAQEPARRQRRRRDRPRQRRGGSQPQLAREMELGPRGRL